MTTAAAPTNTNPLAADLDDVLAWSESAWNELRGARVFVTGGTGFFGRWLLETFAWANDRLDLGARVVVLSRAPDAFVQKAPHLAAHPCIALHAGDVRDFAFPAGAFSHVVHAATDASATKIADDPLEMFATIVDGTRRTLEFARAAGAKRFLLASSGAAYGTQPPEITHVPEDYAGGPETTHPGAVYGEGKRAAETLCAAGARAGGFEAVIARCFAFVGPFLPLDAHYAAGNFVRDGLCGGPIRVGGDGTPLRSYLYAADLAAWLWTLLARGQAGRVYNVGSDEEASIAELARAVAACFDDTVAVSVAGKPVPGRAPARYVPSIARARNELGLQAWTPLPEALRRTVAWHRQNQGA